MRAAGIFLMIALAVPGVAGCASTAAAPPAASPAAVAPAPAISWSCRIGSEASGTPSFTFTARDDAPSAAEVASLWVVFYRADGRQVVSARVPWSQLIQPGQSMSQTYIAPPGAATCAVPLWYR